MLARIAGGVAVSLMSLVLLFIIFVTLSTRLNLPGTPRAFLVQSGSMEPAIHVGDLILVQDSHSYHPREVITFRDTDDRVVTHRIISADDNTFITQGDANKTPDSTPVSSSRIIGKVIGSFPYVGKLVNFARSPLGLILLIFIPAALIIIDEIYRIFKHLSSSDK